jgi:Bacterial archaeo-eukaryotic release factor family 11
MLYVDIPTAAEFRTLAERRADTCVSIYIPTTPITQGTDASRIELKNSIREAARQLREADFDKRRLAALEEPIEELLDDYDFWKHQSNSLAVLATPDDLHTYRLPNNFATSVEVSDRFHLTPLVRTLSFPYSKFVLALSQGAVRLIEVDENTFSAEVSVPDLPSNLSEATGRSMPRDRAPTSRLQGDEGQKVLIRQFARQVDRALRSHLAGQTQPLILAGVRPILDIFRSVCSYPNMLEEQLLGNWEHLSPAELAEMARPLVTREYQKRVRDLHQRFSKFQTQRRTSDDFGQLGTLATNGAVDTLLLDIESSVLGTIDEFGAISFAVNSSPQDYDLIGEIAIRAFLTGAKLVGVRGEDLPGRAKAAAILRYPAVETQRAARA